MPRPEPDAELQPLMQLLKRALYADHPLELLVLVSGLMATTVPRPSLRDEEPTVSLDHLVGTLEDVDLAPTTAALHVIAELTPDELMTARIRRTLRARQQPMPQWLRDLERTELVGVHETSEELDDGRNVVVDVRLPDGSHAAAVIYIDHNIGIVVKDAFTVDVAFAELAPRFVEIEPDIEIAEIDPALARAKIERAVSIGARTYPPIETETWPGQRALIDWMVRLLPGGVELPEWEPMSEEDEAALVDDFLGSSYGQQYGGSQAHLALLDSLLWFGTGYGTCDPLRWSPVNVEVLLVDWFPRKVVAPAEELALMPDLLRSFIRYSHAKRGINAVNRTATLASVDRWEPAYQALIRTDRPQGAEALARMLLTDDQIEALLLEELVDAVGDRETLDHLDDDPLPDEPFDPSEVPDEILPKILEMVSLCDDNADALLDVEHRTANRRLIRLLALADPGYFRGRASARTSAAAVSWMVARANDTISPYGLTSAELLATFGVASVSDRARRFRRMLGIPDHGPVAGPIPLGRADLLVGEARGAIMAERDGLRS